MRDDLGLFVGLIFLIAGAALLYNGVTNSDAQSATIIGGATFLSLGLTVMKA